MKPLNLLPAELQRSGIGGAPFIGSVLALGCVVAAGAATLQAARTAVAAADQEIIRLAQATEVVRDRLDATRARAEVAAARQRAYEAQLAARAEFAAVVALILALATHLPGDVWFDTLEYASDVDTMALRGHAQRRESVTSFLAAVASEVTDYRIAAATLDSTPPRASFALRLVAARGT